jgi:hypothetical protein
VKGILADVNMVGQVAYLIKLMQDEPWPEFWQDLGLTLHRFEDVGLTAAATDVEVWHRCQEHLYL